MTIFYVHFLPIMYIPSPRLCSGPTTHSQQLLPQPDERTILSGASSGGSSTLLVEATSQFHQHQKSNTSNSVNDQQLLRKFTSAVGKPGKARETREAISKVLSCANPSRSVPISEPLDYEHFVGEHSAQLEHDKDRDLLLFLRDDISGVEIWPRERTAVPSVRQCDIDEANWLLAMDALRHYSAPYTVINFNYSRFCGQFTKFDSPQGLNFLRFESDLIADEEKLMLSGQSAPFATQSDILKEGNLVVVPGDGIVDTFRSEKKRFCVLRKPVEDSRVYIEVYKQALAQQQHHQQMPTMEMEVKSVSIKNTKKGKILQLTSSAESDKRTLLLSAENETELQFWLFSIERALAWNNREMMLASEEDNLSLNSSGRENSIPPGPSSLNDSESLASEDSGNSRDFSSAFWRSRNAAAKALQPPIVERRNIFSLYWEMEPLPEPEGEKSTLGEQLSETEQCNAERTSPIPSSSATSLNPMLRPNLCSKRTTVLQESSSLDEETNGTPTVRKVTNHFLEPSTSEFAGEKPAILFTAQLRKLDVRIRLAGKEHPEQIEPFFTRLFLFDNGLGVRVSEEFHVDFPLHQCEMSQRNGHSAFKLANSSPLSSFSLDDVLTSGKVNGISCEMIRNANKLICSIHNPRPDLFLVVLVERILSDVSADIYLKTNHITDNKYLSKIQKSLSASIPRLGHLRTLFAWTARPVFPSLCLGGAFASQQMTINSSSDDAFTPSDGNGTKKGSLATCSLYKCDSGRLTDGDLQKLLTEMQKADKLAKLVALPSAALVLETDVTSVLCEFPMRISSSFLPLRPWRSPSYSPEKPSVLPSFELQSFLHQSLSSEPNRGRVNLLYVYPISLNYSTQKTFSRARNISCTVRYVPSSVVRKAQFVGGRVPSRAHIFHRTHPNGPFVDSFVCGVQYHEQSPQFNTEVKMDLPTSLAEDDHILFTFHHISISSAVTNKNKTSAEHNIEMPVGYAWLPLVRKDARGLSHLVMSDNCQEFELPVAANWSSKYFEFKHMSSSGIREVSSNYDVKFVENGRPLFRVRLRLVSSVFTTDERLQSFFQLCQRLYPNIAQVDNISFMQSSNLSSCDYNIKQSPSLRLYANNTSKNGCSASDIQDDSLSSSDVSIERNLVESIEKLSSIDLDQLIPFLEIVLDRLFSLLTLSKAEDVMLSSLSAIICLADQLFMHRKSKRDLLRNYIRLSFKCQSPPSKCDADGDESTHGAICKCIPLMIHRAQTTKEGLISITKLLRQLWFLLDCAAKSMAHWLIIHNLLKMPRRNRFPTDLYFCLEEMFHTITERIIFIQTECPRESRMANSALGNFLKHCLSLMDRHQIMKELYTVIKKMDTIESRSFRVYKFEMLQLLVGHEHWVPLCLPLLTDKFGIIMRGDNFRIEGSSNQTQQQTTKHNGGTSLLAKLFSQIFSPFHGIISESNEVEKFSSYSEHFFLSKTYCSVHFPIGLLFQELLASLRDSRDHRHKVIRLLRNLLAKHSRDERYGDTSARSRIAMLTMPLLRIAIENIREIEATAVSTNTFTDTQNNSTIMPDNCQNRLLLLTATTHELGRRGEMESNGTGSIKGTINTNDNNGKNNNKTNGSNGGTVVVVLAEKLDKSEVCDLMLCVLYTLSGLPKKMLAAFWNTQETIQPLKTPSSCGDPTAELSKHPQHQQSQQNVLVDFARLLELSLLLFRYRGRTHHLMLQAKRNKATNSNKTYDFLKSDGSNSYRISSKFSTLNEMTLGESFDSRGMADEEGKGGEATSFLMDCNLAQEVALIVLETIQTIANQLAAKTRYASTGTSDAVFLRLLHLQIELIRECWPETVRLHTLSALAVFINLFSTRFFNSGPLDCLSTLIKALLLQLNSRIVRIQTATAALLHLILRSGYDVALNTSVSKFPSDFSSVSAADGSKNSFLTERLGRPGAQIAPVLARLLSEKAVLLNSFRFERGLSALESLVGGGPSTKGGGVGGSIASSSALVLTSLFDKAVLELVKQLRGVLEATQAISDTINDPVHLADLHIQLANSFRGSAALRAEFFDALAAQHLSGAWYSEAAVCQAHSLVIIGKELQGRGLIRPDWTLLDVLSERIAATEGVNESSLMGSTQQGGFTVEEFTRKVEELVRVLLLSERYEAVGPICRLAIPIFEQNNDFKALVGIYAEIQQACSRAAEIKVSGKRHLGTYFKVTFYGNSHFGTEHLTEWIFREPKLTTLAEACDRMVQLVRNAIGHDQVKVISGRSEANDPAIAFIKVAHVEPCRRPTELNNNNIMSTKSGREKGRVVLMTNGGRESDQPKSEGKEDDDPLGYNLHTNISTFIQEERLVDQEVPENAPELARTALRRLTLTVENSFPDSRRRQRIIKTEEAVLNPLELACECLFFKAAQIRHILSAADIPRGCHHHLGTTFEKNALKRLDLKKLQLFLQGSVNAGLLAYAETFTAPAQRHRYGKDGIYRLAAALKTLITELNEALAVNEAAMGSERTEYQQMLRRSFDGMLERLPTFFDGEKFLPDTGGQDGRSAIGVANSQLMNGVLDRLSQIGGTAAEMHIFDSISGLNG